MQAGLADAQPAGSVQLNATDFATVTDAANPSNAGAACSMESA